ncbi:MAG: zinc-dependent metalloprotease [Proteobacteria bacterium]|nr:zinc-dependent metalloprotease [Pseudomonadota bacterium]
MAQERTAAPRPRPAATAESYGALTARMERKDGFFTLFVDKAAGRVFLQLPPADAEGVSARFFYQASLAGGLGSTPVGLDRAETSRAEVMVFRRIGPKVILQVENYGFRADGGSADEKAAVKKSFAVSNIWAGDVEAEAPGGGVLVEITSFLLRDNVDIAGGMKRRKQGTYREALPLSYVDVGEGGVFPDNVELEADQTFVSDEAGPDVRGVAPDGKSVTFTVHHSFVRLPGPGFTPRPYDPRAGGSVQVLFNNYAAPLDQPIAYRLARRFRLEKVDPTQARSRVKKPIIFYLDRAAPEPVRSALLEGARWWAQAFDAAGFVDAFKVELLPEGVSPMDTRYNVINWIHRQTRGWSTGQTIVDPRTGEIVRGVVQLGSLRIRQDELIFQGLVGADKVGKGGPDDPVKLSLARIRQLGMHETGHALGFSHNFAGSTFGDRASAMDYPAPVIRVKGQGLDFSDVYKTGAGDWDRFTVKWLYSEFPKGVDGAKALDVMAKAAEDKGMRFIADDEHPFSTQWDNGTDPVAGLENVMAVRRFALDRFGLGNIPKGAPMADLRRALVPIYLFHRYAIDAATKQVGGVDYAYAVRGDGHEAAKVIPAADQRRALTAVLKTLDPAELDLTDAQIAWLSDGQAATADKQFDIEVFPSQGGPVFDLPGAATIAADLAMSALLKPERLNRVVEQKRRDPGQLGVGELVDQLFAAVAPGAPHGEGRFAEIRRRERVRLVGDIVDALGSKSLSPTAAGELRAGLKRFGEQLAKAQGDAAETAQASYLSAILISQEPGRLNSLATGRATALKPPPGAPIEACWLCETIETF